MSLVRDTFEIEQLIQSLENLLEAKSTHDKERDSYQGYSWGYYGQSVIQAVTDAAEDFGNRLEALIEKRVNQAIEKKGV